MHVNINPFGGFAGLGFFVSVISLVILGLRVYLSYLVAKDAAGRGLSASLCAVAVFLLNVPWGPVVYYLYRQSRVTLRCPNCNNGIAQNYTHCPHCGETLSIKQCPSCAAAIEPGWSVCPMCGDNLPYAPVYPAESQFVQNLNFRRDFMEPALNRILKISIAILVLRMFINVDIFNLSFFGSRMF